MVDKEKAAVALEHAACLNDSDRALLGEAVKHWLKAPMEALQVMLIEKPTDAGFYSFAWILLMECGLLVDTMEKSA